MSGGALFIRLDFASSAGFIGGKRSGLRLRGSDVRRYALNFVSSRKIKPAFVEPMLLLRTEKLQRERNGNTN
jgi:hypothetical protein